eukprot:scaffold117696_cov63-Phaeocystis_antarctica.AAC.2
MLTCYYLNKGTFYHSSHALFIEISHEPARAIVEISSSIFEKKSRRDKDKESHVPARRLCASSRLKYFIVFQTILHYLNRQIHSCLYTLARAPQLLPHALLVDLLVDHAQALLQRLGVRLERGDELLLGRHAHRGLEFDVLGGAHLVRARGRVSVGVRLGLGLACCPVVAARTMRLVHLVLLVAQVAEHALPPAALLRDRLLHREGRVGHLLQGERLALEPLHLLDLEPLLEVIELLEQPQPLLLDGDLPRDPLLLHNLLIRAETGVPLHDTLRDLRLERLHLRLVPHPHRLELLLQVVLDVVEHLDAPCLLDHQRLLQSEHVALDGGELVLLVLVLGDHVVLQPAVEGLELVDQRIQPGRRRLLLFTGLVGGHNVVGRRSTTDRLRHGQ